MKLNHLSLAVPDVPATAAFMQSYFHFTELETKGDKIAVLSGDDDFILVLTALRAEEPAYPADFHFGFMLDRQEAVTSLYEKLIAGGLDIKRPPAKIRNSFAFYFHIPGGIMAEISCIL